MWTSLYVGFMILLSVCLATTYIVDIQHKIVWQIIMKNATEGTKCQ
jgi:hypothetical protein